MKGKKKKRNCAIQFCMGEQTWKYRYISRMEKQIAPNQGQESACYI